MLTRKPYHAAKAALAGVLVTLALGTASRAGAAAAPLDWAQCLDLARRANPELQGGRSTVRAHAYGQEAAYGGFFPQVAASVGYTKDSFSANGSPAAVTSGYSAALTATQNLFTGLADKAKVDRAGAKLQQAVADFEALAARLSYELKAAFAGLSYAQKAIELSRGILERRQANLKLVQLRYESGRENKGNVMVSEANLEQAQLDLLQAERAVDTARAELARVLGVRHADDLAVTGTIPTSPPPPTASFTELVDLMPEYKKAQAAEREAEAGVAGARAPFFPSLNVTGALGSGGSYFFPRDSSRWSVGVALVIPLFNGGTDYYALKSATEFRTAATLGKENAFRLGSTKLRQALTSYHVTVRKLEVDRRFLDAASVRSRVAREKYNNGLLSFEDWDLIENEYINRQKTYLGSERDRIVAEAFWEQSQGKGVFK